MHHRKWENDITYEVGSLTNELRNEVDMESDFGRILSNNLKNGIVEKEHQKRLWKQVFNKSIEIDFLFLHIGFSGERFETLIESAKEFEIEFKVVLNLFLSEERIEDKARIFAKNHRSFESIPEEEFVKKILAKEELRITTLSGIKNLAKVVNINCDCPEVEIVENILEEIKVGN